MNSEALEYVKRYLARREDDDPKLFKIGWEAYRRCQAYLNTMEAEGSSEERLALQFLAKPFSKIRFRSFCHG